MRLRLYVSVFAFISSCLIGGLTLADDGTPGTGDDDITDPVIIIGDIIID